MGAGRSHGPGPLQNAEIFAQLATPPTMRWRVHPIGEFDRRSSDWNALNADAGDLPFLRSEFLLPALDEFGSGTELLVTFGENNQYAAMGVLKRLRPGMWETFQPSQLPLGAFLLR